MITISEVEKVTKVASSPEDKLSAVYEYLAQPSKVQTYMGEVEAHYMGKKSSLDPNAQIISQEDQNLTNRNKVALAKISKLVSSGLISHGRGCFGGQGKKLLKIEWLLFLNILLNQNKFNLMMVILTRLILLPQLTKCRLRK